AHGTPIRSPGGTPPAGGPTARLREERTLSRGRNALSRGEGPLTCPRLSACRIPDAFGWSGRPIAWANDGFRSTPLRMWQVQVIDGWGRFRLLTAGARTA